MKQTNQVTFTFFLHFCADSTADMMHNQEYIHRDSFLYENWCVDMEKSGMFKNILIRASKKRIKNYQRTNEKFQRRFFNVHTRDVYNSCILKMVMINAECRRRHTQKKMLYKRSQQQRKKCETINKAMMVICMWTSFMWWVHGAQCMCPMYVYLLAKFTKMTNIKSEKKKWINEITFWCLRSQNPATVAHLLDHYVFLLHVRLSCYFWTFLLFFLGFSINVLGYGNWRPNIPCLMVKNDNNNK